MGGRSGEENRAYQTARRRAVDRLIKIYPGPWRAIFDEELAKVAAETDAFGGRTPHPRKAKP